MLSFAAATGWLVITLPLASIVASFGINPARLRISSGVMLSSTLFATNGDNALILSLVICA